MFSERLGAQNAIALPSTARIRTLTLPSRGRKRLYVDGAEQPCLIVNDMKLEPKAGRVALWVGPGTEGYFANLKISAK